MRKKLKQRLLIKYYKTKLNTIGLFSTQQAALLAFDLFSTPFKSKSKRIVPPIFHKAIPITVKVNEMIVRGFQWKQANPEAKKILIVHGFSSYAYKFDQYVLSLIKEGFEVIAFDAPGHGNSEGKRINALIYRDTLIQIENTMGPIYGMIAHSLGGLSAALALEAFDLSIKRKLVLIAPATETKTAINHFFNIIPAEPKIINAFEAYIETLANHPLSYFSVARVAKRSLAQTLWVHDEEDTVCTFNDVKPLLKEQIPLLEFLITKGLGHNQLYKEQHIKEQIIHFLSATE